MTSVVPFRATPPQSMVPVCDMPRRDVAGLGGGHRGRSDKA